MTPWTLILQSLRFRWRSHLGVVLGAAVGSAALIGALIVGDSVRGTLREQALARLGEVWFALSPPDRFVTDQLPNRMPGRLPDSWRTNEGHTWAHYATKPAGILLLPATVTREDQSARASRVNLIGVGYDREAAERNDTISFWHFAAHPAVRRIPPGEIWLNRSLATQLRARPADTLIVRVVKPALLSREAPIAPQSEASASLRLKVGQVRTASELGDFSLRASQVPPLNAFVNLEELQRLTGTTGRVNVLVSPQIVVDKNRDHYRVLAMLDKIGLGRLADLLPLRRTTYLDTPAALHSFQEDLKRSLRLADLEVELRHAPGSCLELTSRRVFLDEPLVRTTLASNRNAQLLLTYLVNQFRVGTNSTPYSMVTAAGARSFPPDMRDDEILVNQWLADDLQVKPGDSVELSYYLVDSGGLLVERTNSFRVRGIVPLKGIYADRTLMPEFPGLAKAESTHDWDAGFPLVYPIRAQDEQYLEGIAARPRPS